MTAAEFLRMQQIPTKYENWDMQKIYAQLATIVEQLSAENKDAIFDCLVMCWELGFRVGLKTEIKVVGGTKDTMEVVMRCRKEEED